MYTDIHVIIKQQVTTVSQKLHFSPIDINYDIKDNKYNN
jgi:hypothetical protein